MKLVTLSMAVAAACVFAQTAQARGYHHHRYGYRHRASRQVLEKTGYGSEGQSWQQWPSDSADDWSRGARRERRQYSGEGSGYADAGLSERRRFFRHRRSARDVERGEGRGDVTHDAERADYRGGYGARPAAWCGWEMRHLVGADPGPQYNLARNWGHWGHSGPAGVGAVVVWAHHVGKIVGREDGEWVIESGNDGHRMRTRPRSIGGAIAIRWG
jgi:hypothetical protein